MPVLVFLAFQTLGAETLVAVGPTEDRLFTLSVYVTLHVTSLRSLRAPRGGRLLHPSAGLDAQAPGTGSGRVGTGIRTP